MKILMRRKQTPGRFFGVTFKLWAKLELKDDEQAIIDRYDFDQSILIWIPVENRIRNSLIVGALVGVAIFFLVGAELGRTIGGFAAIAAAIGATWFLMDYWRETVYVKDLLHGRNFDCKSIERLVSKEYFLNTACGYLRQVMETAKHWDGTESKDIAKLDPEMAKRFLFKYL